MNFAIYFLLITATTADYLRSQQLVPGATPYIAEGISGLIAIYVIFVGVQSRFQNLRASYMITMLYMLLLFGCSSLLNSVDAGPLVAGARAWLRFFPLFLLPFVLETDERALKRQLLLLLLVCAAQFPLSLSQRLHNYGHVYISGDRTFGTLMSSGLESIFLICAGCVLGGFFLRKHIRLWTFVPVLLWTLASTTINETKVTLFLVPIGLFGTFIAGSPPKVRMRNGALAFGMTALFLAVFVPVYDSLEGARTHKSILDFFSNEKAVSAYMASNAGIGSSEKKQAGRVESLTVPLEYIARDPASLAFGLGPGNASESSLGAQFTGRYAKLLGRFLQPTASRLMSELGLLGLCGVLLMMWLVFSDSRYLADADQSIVGALAIGWTGVIPVVVVGMFYSATAVSNGISVVFWYLSGVIAARRSILLRRAQVAVDSAPAVDQRLAAPG